MEKRASRQTLLFAAVLILLFVALLLSIAIGKYPISLREIADIAAGRPVADLTRRVFLTLRLPRTIMAFMAGLALGMGGAVFQMVFKNPLASPDIVGVPNAANLGAAAAIVLLGGNMAAIALCAFAGGMLAVAGVIGLSRIANRRGTIAFVLGGIAIKAMADALVMTFKYFADTEKELEAIEFWSMGTFKSITMEKLLFVLPAFLIGLIGLILLRYQISLLSLSDDESRMLGVNPSTMRYLVLGCSTLMIASVTSVSGIIIFVGLIAPHISRILLGKNNFTGCVFSGLIGAVILLGADCLARSLTGAELPISILTSLIGVPFLVYFMTSKRYKL